MRTHKKTNATTQQATPKTIAVLGVVLAALLLSGCYWTPDSNEAGDLAVNISVPVSSSSVGSQELGALQTASPSAFLYAFAIDEALLAESPQAAAEWYSQIGFWEVISAMSATFEQFSGDPTPSQISEAIAAFRLDTGLGSGRFQQAPIDATSGNTSGTVNFSELPGGRSFIVGVYGVVDTSEGDIFVAAVSTSTIQAGGTTTVNLEPVDDLSSYYTDMVARYGVAARVRISFSAPLSAPDFTHYQVLDATAFDTSTESNFANITNNASSFDTWFSSPEVVTVSTVGASTTKTDPRPALPPANSEGQFEILGLIPGRSWRVLLTTWEDGNAPVPGDAGLSAEFDTSASGILNVELNSGSGSGEINSWNCS